MYICTYTVIYSSPFGRTTRHCYGTQYRHNARKIYLNVNSSTEIYPSSFLQFRLFAKQNRVVSTLNVSRNAYTSTRIYIHTFAVLFAQNRGQKAKGRKRKKMSAEAMRSIKITQQFRCSNSYLQIMEILLCGRYAKRSRNTVGMANTAPP